MIVETSLRANTRSMATTSGRCTSSQVSNASARLPSLRSTESADGGADDVDGDHGDPTGRQGVDDAEPAPREAGVHAEDAHQASSSARTSSLTSAFE